MISCIASCQHGLLFACPFIANPTPSSRCRPRSTFTSHHTNINKPSNLYRWLWPQSLLLDICARPAHVRPY